MLWCVDCHAYHFTGDKCFPIFELFYDDWYGDDWQEIRGRDMEHAVERWADIADADGDYSIVGQSMTPIVLVRPKGSTDAVLLKVSGESVPSYRSTPAAWCAIAECTSRGDAKAVNATMPDGTTMACDGCWHRHQRELREARA